MGNFFLEIREKVDDLNVIKQLIAEHEEGLQGE
ncbi:hypothetical protein H4683_001450 [Filibacter limicola]|uniref:Uncharacterized protein n=1 Tax=Sporosarcina limicola TaxID=34101 RepID=A0A927MGW0_9BACL|nr:hypothetical protein [Sporosarcina limicola]